MWGKQEGSGRVTRPAQESELDPGPALTLGPARPLRAVVLGLLQRGKEARPRAASPAQLQSWPADLGAPGVQLRPTPHPHLRSADGEVEAQPGAGAWPTSHNRFEAEAGPLGPQTWRPALLPLHPPVSPMPPGAGVLLGTPGGAGDPLGAPLLPDGCGCPRRSLGPSPPCSGGFSSRSGCWVMPVPVAPAFQHRTWREVGAGGRGGESPCGTPPAEFLSLASRSHLQGSLAGSPVRKRCRALQGRGPPFLMGPGEALRGPGVDGPHGRFLLARAQEGGRLELSVAGRDSCSRNMQLGGRRRPWA